MFCRPVVYRTVQTAVGQCCSSVASCCVRLHPFVFVQDVATAASRKPVTDEGEQNYSMQQSAYRLSVFAVTACQHFVFCWNVLENISTWLTLQQQTNLLWTSSSAGSFQLQSPKTYCSAWLLVPCQTYVHISCFSDRHTCTAVYNFLCLVVPTTESGAKMALCVCCRCTAVITTRGQSALWGQYNVLFLN